MVYYTVSNHKITSMDLIQAASDLRTAAGKHILRTPTLQQRRQLQRYMDRLRQYQEQQRPLSDLLVRGTGLRVAELLVAWARANRDLSGWLDAPEALVEASLHDWFSLRRGTVYLAVNEAQVGIVKIGRTQQPVSARLRQLNNEGVVGRWKEAAHWRYADAIWLEDQAHARLREWRLKDEEAQGRELFRASVPLASGFIGDLLEHDRDQLYRRGLGPWLDVDALPSASAS